VSLTDEQVAARRHWIGGSDAAALAGVNPPNWSQPIDVYLDKVGLAPARPQSKLMALGSLMEDLVFTLATEATGITWRRPGRPVHSRQYPWAGGNVDRYGTDPSGLPIVGEGKWTTRRDGWGDSWQALRGPDGAILSYQEPEATSVPLHYAIQVQHYLAVTGRPAGVLAALMGYGDFRWYVLPRNEALIGWLMEIEERFWRDHVLAGVPPAPDGSAGYGRHLRSTYATDDATEAVATPEQQALAKVLQGTRAELALAARADEAAAQALQDTMRTTAKLVGPGFSIRWRQNNPSLSVEWEPLATELLRQLREARADPAVEAWPKTKKAQAELVRVVARSLELANEQPGSRPFLATFDAQQEDQG
jgi:predicted phage-related endonuclease